MTRLDQEYSQMKDLPSDPLHPIYYHVFKNTLPLEQAYRIVDDRKSHGFTLLTILI